MVALRQQKINRGALAGATLQPSKKIRQVTLSEAHHLLRRTAARTTQYIIAKAQGRGLVHSEDGLPTSHNYKQLQ